MLGPDQPVILQLLEITPALPALHGVVMELNDCAFPPLARRGRDRRRKDAFKDRLRTARRRASSRPRHGAQGPARRQRAIFGPQGKALDAVANRDVKVLVVGNPANTNALIAQRKRPSLNPRNFTAMVRLDHNRALGQLAEKTGTHINDIKKMTIWGNHSSTQYPDMHHTWSTASRRWPGRSEVVRDTFIPTVQQRGAAIIKARGASSAASAASAAIDHMRDWALGTADGDWVSMGVPSDGSYGIRRASIYGYPVTCKTASTRSCRASRSTTSAAQRMDAT